MRRFGEEFWHAASFNEAVAPIYGVNPYQQKNRQDRSGRVVAVAVVLG